MSLACPRCENGPNNCKCLPEDMSIPSPSKKDVSTIRDTTTGSNFLKDEKGRVLCPGCNDPVKEQDVAMITNLGPWHRMCAMSSNTLGGDVIREPLASPTLKATKASKDKQTTNPQNAYKYFDHSRGMTFNRKCPCCKTDTWVQESTHTTYEGKRYMTNQIDLLSGESDTVGVMHGISTDKFDCETGIWCLQCYEKEFKPTRDFYDG